jgi:hypothetical protein
MAAIIRRLDKRTRLIPLQSVAVRSSPVTVSSGPMAPQGTGFLRWTDQNIWNNSGDPRRLFDADGNVVAETAN